MSSSNHMGKTFIEANCDNNKHTGENAFLHLLLLKGFFFRQSNETCSILGTSLFYIFKEDRPNEYCLCEVSLFFPM